MDKYLWLNRQLELANTNQLDKLDLNNFKYYKIKYKNLPSLKNCLTHKLQALKDNLEHYSVLLLKYYILFDTRKDFFDIKCIENAIFNFRQLIKNDSLAKMLRDNFRSYVIKAFKLAEITCSVDLHKFLVTIESEFTTLIPSEEVVKVIIIPVTENKELIKIDREKYKSKGKTILRKN